MKGFFEEFKKFITRGNVIDMSVGVIVGGAFTAIVNGMGNYTGTVERTFATRLPCMESVRYRQILPQCASCV